MSLRVWLSLNGTLDNQGLDSVVVTNNGATIDNSGKIGKCYSFNGSNSRISCSSHTWTYPMSICAWFKPTDVTNSNTQYWLSYNTASGGTTGHAIGIGIYGSKLSVWFGGQVRSLSATLSNNIWYHIAFTIDANKKAITYLNGEQIDTITFTTNKPDSIWFTIGARSNSSTGGVGGASYFYKGYMNDVRLYDHALSPMEVKQISQGLILHYPLNRGGFGQENLLKNSKLDGSWEYPSTSYKDRYAPITVSVPTGSVYTLSFDAKSTVNGDKIRTHYYSPNTTTTCTSSQGIMRNAVDGNMDFTLSTQWKRYWVVYNQNETSAVKHVICPRMVSGQGTGVVSVKNVKLEEGSIATPWCPNSSDVLATTMGLNDNIQYDTSGYGNNGTKIGSFSYNSDTPKYNVSQHFNGTNYIGLAPPCSEIQTVVFWVKWDNIPSTQTIGFIDDGSGLAFGLSYGNIIVSGEKAGGRSACYNASVLSAGNWYHIVVVKTGNTTRKLYINAIEQATNSSSNYWSYINNELQIGKRKNTGEGIIGQMSDFRAYVTALSAEDIKSLYNNSAYIDNQGNMYGAVYEEV